MHLSHLFFSLLLNSNEKVSAIFWDHDTQIHKPTELKALDTALVHYSGH